MSQDDQTQRPAGSEQQTGPITDQEQEDAIQRGGVEPEGSSAANVEQAIADIEEKRAEARPQDGQGV